MATDQRDRLFRRIEFMAHHGLHAKAIAEVAGCSVGSVYTALHKLQIRLRDYRDGKGPVGKMIVIETKKIEVNGI